MAIASVGTLGTGANSTSNSSYTFNTATNSLASGDFGILVSVSDNTSTTDGNNNEHTSVSGGTGTWTKLGEYTNAEGSAGAGVTVSCWLFQASGTVNTGTTITLNFASNRTDKCCAFWKFTKGAGTSIALLAGATNPITSEVSATNGFGSSAFSSLSSLSRLYLRALGKEANSTTALTVSTNFTELTGTRSRNNASAVLVRGEFRINTSTGETSNPTLAVSGDTAGLFFALEEVTRRTVTTSADAAVQNAYSVSASANGGVQYGRSATASLSGFVDIQTGYFSPVLIAGGIGALGTPPPVTLTASVGAAVQAGRTATASLNGGVQAGASAAASANAGVQAAQSATASLSAQIQQDAAGGFFSALLAAGGIGSSPTSTPVTATASVNAAVQLALNATATVNGAVQAGLAATASLDASVFGGVVQQATLDAAVQSARTATAGVGGAVQASPTATASLAAGVQASPTATASASAGVQVSRTATASADGAVQLARTVSASVEGAVFWSRTGTASVNAYVEAGGVPLGGFLGAALLGGGIGAAGPAVSQPRPFDEGVPVAWRLDPGWAGAYSAPQLGVSVASRSAVAFTASATASVDGAVQLARSGAAQVSAAVQSTPAVSTGLAAYVQGGATVAASADAAVQAPRSATGSLEAAVQRTLGVAADVQAAVQAGRALAAGLSAHVADALLVACGLDAAVQAARATAATLGGAVQQALGVTAGLGAYVQPRSTATASLGAFISATQVLGRPRGHGHDHGSRRSTSGGGRRSNTQSRNTRR